jgi:hypothetical protein
MINVTYTSSRGKVFNLLSFDSAKLEKADFNKYSWGKEVVSRQFGEIVNRFTKSAQSFDCTFKFKGSHTSRKALIEAFNFESEYDICHNAVGRITWGKCYIEGYWISADTTPVDDGGTYTQLTKTFYAPFPFWIEEQKLEIFPTMQGSEDETTKGYVPSENRYGYSYSYGGAPTTIYIDTDHYKDSDFKVIAYGPAPSVEWTIGTNHYKVDYALRDNQYMVIDSRQLTPPDRQLYVVNESGIITNVFDYRSSVGDIFKRFPAGKFIFNYPRTYGLQLTLFKERSEPR